ncbi:Probable lipoprotein Cj1090c [hydrothermal vent metagenome]|uniref:Probable lipoprotein Cj1090c n=1 Tax=hydrothermal vent metagenome TaxID=652676 RepID=A0A3B1DQU8_9ZZZZ
MSYYVKNEINGNVFIDLNVYTNNTVNSVYLKEIANEIIISEIGASLTNNSKKADTSIVIYFSNISFIALEYDVQGYVKLYRTTVHIKFNYKNKEHKIRRLLNVSASHDYFVDESSIITDLKKEESIKIATRKALSEIFSKVGTESLRYNK